MTQKQTSIVIRCYNEEEHIGRLLSGIIQQSIQDVEIIIVDSGSTDATLSIASRFPVRIFNIRPDEFSFGRSLNTGCRAATGEYVIIASAHVYPIYIDWIEQLLSPFADDKIALVYGKQRGNEKTKYAEHQVFANWFPDESNPDQGHPFCNNANAAIRRSVWSKLPYDEALTGLEDIDWAKRSIQLGLKIAYQSEALVAHVHNERARQIYNRYRREAIAFKNIYPNENFTFRKFIRLFWVNTLSDYRHALNDNVLGTEWLEILRFRLMQFWGTCRGFNHYDTASTQLKRTFYYPNRHRDPAPNIRYKDRRRLVNYRREERL